MLGFESVGVRYADGTRALRDVSLVVPRGQFCVVLGASGAGKSTLLRMVNGLVAPSAGVVRVAGEPVGPRSLRAVRAQVGMIHQQFNLVQRSTVATNVLCGALPGVSTLAALLGLFPERFRRKACELVAAVGLTEGHLARRVRDLSGGQQQRVGIARAFMMDPPLVLADEPVASLDPRTSRDVLDLLKRQAREREATVMCSLHQVDLAREYADRIVALRDGRVVFDGPPSACGPDVLASVYDHAEEEAAP